MVGGTLSLSESSRHNCRKEGHCVLQILMTLSWHVEGLCFITLVLVFFSCMQDNDVGIQLWDYYWLLVGIKESSNWVNNKLREQSESWQCFVLVWWKDNSMTFLGRSFEQTWCISSLQLLVHWTTWSPLWPLAIGFSPLFLSLFILSGLWVQCSGSHTLTLPSLATNSHSYMWVIDTDACKSREVEWSKWRTDKVFSSCADNLCTKLCWMLTSMQRCWKLYWNCFKACIRWAFECCQVAVLRC